MAATRGPLGVRILPSEPLAEHPGQSPKVGSPADAEHLARKDRTLRVPIGAPHPSNCRHTEVVGHDGGDFPVPRSLIRRLAELLDDRDNTDDREGQSPDVSGSRYPPFVVHGPDATSTSDGSYVCGGSVVTRIGMQSDFAYESIWNCHMAP